MTSHLAAQVPDFQTPNASVSAFVKDRLLYKPRNVTTKWPGVPKLEIISNSPAMKIYVEQTFLSLCQAAGLTAPGEGTYHVFIGSKEEFSK
ncbi:MAG: hypothetical protein Q8M07_18220, partial [Prosthecobacter sp.]|nr:hypothetical protein [Prosthecobacter sp.]